MVRVFIAIDVEDETLRDKLCELQRELVRTGSQMKLVERENLHLTLKFIGEIPPSRVDPLIEAVKRACEGFSKFKVHIAGMGAFPSVTRPRVVWVGVKEGADVLVQLARRVEEETVRAGFRKSDKPFSPHITLARVKVATTFLVDVIRKYENVDIGEMLVSEVRVKKSTLTPSGPIYETLAKLSLIHI